MATNTADFRAPEPIAKLLGVTASIASLAALIGQLAPLAKVSMNSARLVAVAWAASSLLLTAWWTPSRGDRRLPWFLALSALYVALFMFDVQGVTPAHLCLVTLAVLTTGALVGGYIGSLLEYPGMLMVVAYVAAFADCFSFFHPAGLTANVLRHPKALALLTLPFPILGTDAVASLVGIGDVAFVALYVAGSRATGLDARRTVVALGLAMLSVAVTVEWLGAPLPALPFLGAAVLVAQPAARRLPVQHTRRIAANLAVVTLVLGGLLISAALRSS